MREPDDIHDETEEDTVAGNAGFSRTIPWGDPLTPEQIAAESARYLRQSALDLAVRMKTPAGRSADELVEHARTIHKYLTEG